MNTTSMRSKPQRSDVQICLAEVQGTSPGHAHDTFVAAPHDLGLDGTANFPADAVAEPLLPTASPWRGLVFPCQQLVGALALRLRACFQEEDADIKVARSRLGDVVSISR